MGYTFWLVILGASLQSRANAQNLTIINENNDLARIVLFIAREHLGRLTSTVGITEKSFRRDKVSVHESLMDFLLQNLHETISVQLRFDNRSENNLEYFIFIVDSPQAFGQLRSGISLNFNERHFRFLIVLTNYRRNFHKDVKQIFQLCYQFNVLDASLVLEHVSLGVCMFTYNLFSNEGCRVVQPVLSYRFGDGLDNFELMFDKRLLNFYGCPLRVSIRHNPPVLLKKNFSGFEGELMKLIATQLNFRVDVLPMHNEQSYLANSTAYGCFRQLLNGTADVAVGAFSRSHPGHWHFSLARSVYQSSFVYIIRGRPPSPLKRLSRPFNYRVWILIAFILVFGLGCGRFITYMRPAFRKFVLGETNDKPIIEFLASFFGNPIVNVASRNFARYLLMMWMLLTLVLRSAYQGSLYDAFRMRTYAKIPSGIDEMLRSGYRILAPPETVSLEIFPAEKTISVAADNVERMDLLLQTLEKYATPTFRENFLDYIVWQCKFECDLVMIEEVFNKKLQELDEAGLVKNFRNFFSAELTMWKKFKEKKPAQTLTNGRLEGLYLIFGTMSMVAILVFLLEVLSGCSRRLRVLIEWLN